MVLITPTSTLALYLPAIPMRHSAPCMWTAETVTTIEIPNVSARKLAAAYADFSRMTEWSPLLESVSVDADSPLHSDWVMKVPRPLKVVARALGYPEISVAWRAVLESRQMKDTSLTWHSLIGETGVQNAGSVTFTETSSNPLVSSMTMKLRYTLPDPVARWKSAMIEGPVVQSIIRRCMAGGMTRFSSVMQAEASTQTLMQQS